MNHVTWIAISAIIVGAVVRALKADALGAILTRLFRPDGPPIAIPSRLLPWLALGFGGVAALLDARVAGETWSEAAKAGVMAAALAVFGHELGSGVPGLKRLLGVLMLIVPLSVATTSCSLVTKDNAKSALDAIQIGCVFGTELVEEEAVADACGIARELIPVIRNLIGQREAAKRAGVVWPGADAGVSLDAGEQ